MMLGENTKVLIINNSLNEQLEVSYVEGDLSINPVKKERRKWGALSEEIIIEKKVSINFSSFWTERKLEDWIGDNITFQITLDANADGEDYVVNNVKIDNLKFSWGDKKLVDFSGSVVGILA